MNNYRLLSFLIMIMANYNLFAYDIAVKNKTGILIYYNYIEDGQSLEVTHGDRPYKGNVIVPEDVTYMNRTRKVIRIGKDAFRYASGLISVKLPQTITTIGECAFGRCSSLTSVNIPNNVTDIEYGAFQDCTKLRSIKLPGSVTEIGRTAFYNCDGIISIIIPEKIKVIKTQAFYGCSALKTVIINEGVEEIEPEAFSWCEKITSITIPSSVKKIGEMAFEKVNLQVVISYIDNPKEIAKKSSDFRTFSQNTFNNATLYVPIGTKEKYKAIGGWKDFLFIEEGEGPNQKH